MLYFSDTVWVLICSSSLPALDGALESSKGEAKGPPIPCSEAQLDLLEDIEDPGLEGPGLCAGESVYGLGALEDREGGSNISEDSTLPGAPYNGRDDAGSKFRV